MTMTKQLPPTTTLFSTIAIFVTACTQSASSFIISSSSTNVASTSRTIITKLLYRPINVTSRPLTTTTTTAAATIATFPTICRRSGHSLRPNSFHSHILNNPNTRTVYTPRKRSIMMSTNSREEVNEEAMEEGQRQGLADIGRATSVTSISTSTSSSPSANTDINKNDNSLQSWKNRIDISIAKSRSTRGSNYVQLSTVDGKTCEPRCRTVVFRGFVKGPTPQSLDSDGSGGDFGTGCVMKMITDARSSKVHEVACTRRYAKEGEDETKTIRNTAEMVWWFPKSSEQYRVRGQLQFIGSDGPLDDDISDDAKTNAEEYIAKKFLTEQRRQQWGNLSDMAREQFYWENPGEPFVVTPSPSTSSTIPKGGRDDDGKVLPPPDTFLLMLLYPTRVDYLRLSDNYHQVDDLERGDGIGRSGRWIAKRVNP